MKKHNALKAYQTVLTGLMSTYGVSGIIDILAGTSTTPLDLAQTLEELKSALSFGFQDELGLICRFENQLNQLLHNVRAETTDEGHEIMFILNRMTGPRIRLPATDEEIDMIAYDRSVILNIIHLALQELKEVKETV